MTSNTESLILQLLHEVREGQQETSKAVQSIESRLTLGNQRFDAIEQAVANAETSRKCDLDELRKEIQPVIDMLKVGRGASKINRLLPGGGVVGIGAAAYARFRGWW